MYTIGLHDLHFFAHHGLHEEEAITGTDFKVDVNLAFEPGWEISSLEDTINYVTVFDVIQQHFSKRVKLLETLAEDICRGIHHMDNRIKTINIRISKLNPPIGNFTGTVSVSCEKSY